MFGCDNGSGNSNNNDDPPDNTPTFESQFYGKWDFRFNNVSLFQYTFSEGHTFIEHNKAGKYTAKGTWSAESPNKFNMTFTHMNESPVATLAELVELETPDRSEGEVEWVSDDSFIWTIKTTNGEPNDPPSEFEFVRAE